VRNLRALSLVAVGILVWTLVFAGCSGSGSITVTLAPASGESLNPGATVTITATVANDKTNGGVTWTLSGPGSLSGNTTTSVVYTAPSNISTNTTATITATSVANSSVTATESITLTAVLTISTTSLPAGALGVPYSAFVNAAGATGAFTWTITSGSLPAGLTFQTTSTSSSAQITGTPTLLQTSKFTVQVTDAAGSSVTQALSITINPPPPLAVATASVPNGTVGVLYPAFTLQASSGVLPYTWSITAGSLPLGFNPLSSGGVISGTPQAAGTSSFTVKVVDSSSPPQSATANLSITVNSGANDNSKLNGNYAFSVRGFDSSGPQLPLFVAAGSFVADGNGNITSGLMDVNNTASDPVNPTFTGTYTIDPNGFGFLFLNIAGLGSRTYAISMMASGNANIIEFDDSNGGGTRDSGVLLKQEPGPFSLSSVSGNYAFGFLGIDSSKNRFGLAGEFVADGGGNLCLTSANCLLDSDDSVSGPSPSVPIAQSSYTVASNGRGTLNIKTAQGTTGYSFYIVNSSELLVIETDNFLSGGNPLVSGAILTQTTTSSFTSASVFELTALNPSGPTAESQVGLFAGISGGFNLTSDQNTGGTLTQPSGSGTYIITNGRVAVTPTTNGSSGFQNSTPTSQPVFYMVSDNEAFVIGSDTAVSFGFMTPQVQPGTYTSTSLSGTYAGGSLAPVDLNVSNIVGIAIAGSNTLNFTLNVSGPNGLLVNQPITATTSVESSGRVTVAETGNTQAAILYMVSPAQFFSLSGQNDTTARVDIFQQ
jgi:hypothetical protein